MSRTPERHGMPFKFTPVFGAPRELGQRAPTPPAARLVRPRRRG